MKINGSQKCDQIFFNKAKIKFVLWNLVHVYRDGLLNRRGRRQRRGRRKSEKNAGQRPAEEFKMSKKPTDKGDASKKDDFSWESPV